MQNITAHSVPQKIGPKVKIISSPPVLSFPMGFFDGDATDTSRGARVYIVISESHQLHIKMGCGISTNTCAELLALWTLLFISKEIGFPYLHVFGDSSAVINWAKDLSSLSILNLDAWCINIKKLIASFFVVDFKHVYREHNENEDTLSKEGLIMASCQLSFTEYCEGVFIGEASLQLF